MQTFVRNFADLFNSCLERCSLGLLSIKFHSTYLIVDNGGNLTPNTVNSFKFLIKPNGKLMRKITQPNW